MGITFYHVNIASGTGAVLTLDASGGGGGGGSSYQTSFTNSSLSAGLLNVVHGLAQEYVVVVVYDDNDNQILPNEITVVDTNRLTVDLTGFVPITGTWNVSVTK